MQVQGPASVRTLEKLVGPAIYDLKYYWCDRFEIGGMPVVISRTGFTAAPGFEVNCLEFAHGDALWEVVLEAGEEFGIRVAAPSMAKRIEAGMMNHGSDMTIEHNPFQIMGLERLVEEQPQDYGQGRAERIRREGGRTGSSASSSRQGGLEIDPADFWPVFHGGKEVGRVTDAVAPARAQHRLRVGAGRAVGAGHEARHRVAARTHGRNDRHDPLRRSEEAGPGSVAPLTGVVPGA